IGRLATIEEKACEVVPVCLKEAQVVARSLSQPERRSGVVIMRLAIRHQLSGVAEGDKGGVSKQAHYSQGYGHLRWRALALRLPVTQQGGGAEGQKDEGERWKVLHKAARREQHQAKHGREAQANQCIAIHPLLA